MSKKARIVKVRNVRIIIGNCRICGIPVDENSDYAEKSGVFTCEICSNGHIDQGIEQKWSYSREQNKKG